MESGLFDSMVCQAYQGPKKLHLDTEKVYESITSVIFISIVKEPCCGRMSAHQFRYRNGSVKM